jgi:hypothetical protein
VGIIGKDMKIKFKSIVGKVYEFDVEPTDKVYTLKPKISEKIGISKEYLNLVYNGVPLKDDKTFDEQGVKPDSLIRPGGLLRGSN